MNHSMNSDYMAHGFCFSWEGPLVWLHVASDIMTGIAYYAIAFAMAYFLLRKRDEPFFLVFVLFALFIMACGTTHLFAAYTVYVPDYWPEGYVKAFTSLISVGTAMVFIPKIPRAIEMPSLAKTLHEVQQLSARQQVTEDKLVLKVAELERFNYTVSHDLKSPLITIKGFAGALEKDLAEGRYERMAGDLKRISTAADKMDSLLSDLLELSRVGHVAHSPESVSMSAIGNEVVAHLDGILRSTGIEVIIQPDLPTVLCDRQRMSEVVQNLVENAVKYMGEQKEPKILFGMRVDDGENVYYVKDNGIGIEEKYQQNIFGLFNQLNAQSPGTGIGLALVKRIIEVHGGRIWVESAGLGKGSTFCFTLGK